MDSKDFASLGEADQLDFAYRFPLYSTMELFIETLTGTCFELRVSPYETVISVKAKIQRLEGIPITQQYLIWQDTELEDDYCLRDYNITDGCTLKLVLAMRGGPINTRRVAMEDSSMREMADYVESNQDELLEKLSPPPTGGNSNKQVTLLVYRDGDQLNFFRVVDRGDGTLTPLTESLSGSTCNLREDEDYTEEKPSPVLKGHSPATQGHLSSTQMMENRVTASKMKLLQTRFQNLNVTSKKTAQNQNVPNSKPFVPVPPAYAKGETEKSLFRSKGLRREAPKKLNGFVPTSESRQQPPTPKPGNRSPVPPKQAPNPESGDLQLTSVSQSKLLRARLRRSRNLRESGEEKPAKIPPQTECEDEDPSPRLIGKVATEHGPPAKLNADDLKAKRDSPTNLTPSKDPDTGRSSPRTKRLLCALESSPPKKETPRSSSLLQGLTYNRHDMYLRSYGLIQSPDDDAAEETGAPSPTKTSPKPENSEISPHVFETSHGVKYSSVGNSLAPYHWGGRLLKSPPAFGEPNAAGLSREPSTSIWQQQKLKREAGSTTEKSRADPFNLAAQVKVTEAHHKTEFNPLKLDDTAAKKNEYSLHVPQPPSSSQAISSSWHKQRLKRINSKPSQPETAARPHPLAPITGPGGPDPRPNPGELPLSSPRRPLRDVTSKSGLRMKETSNGKMESISRKEAREFVDLINKAVDASILRSLVRSPVKDGTRGNSGQSSGRHRTAHHNLDLNRTNLKSSHSNHTNLPPSMAGPSGRVPSVLPPVKQPSKKKRCFQCAKRTGLASSYMCRCGNNFCATHRYAEMHSCTYDYKTAGRKLLEEANPLVSAPKLPKI